MRHLVFLLEGPSERDALAVWLPRWLPDDVQPHFLVFEGKQDMEKRMALKMRYWQLPNSRFLVLRDKDSGDCHAVKAALRARCDEAGRPDAVVRIARLAALARSAKYRDPDRIAAPEAELRRHLPGYQKRDGARRIAPHMHLDRNASCSFMHLRDAILRLATG